MCLEPAPDQESTYRPTFDDYALQNKTEFVLERKFNLPEYLLVAPEEWTTRSAPRTLAAVSAVGFNPGRTRVAVCLWAGSSGTCYSLIKQAGAWRIDRDWRGNGCFRAV